MAPSNHISMTEGRRQRSRTLILDLGDVIFHWSSQNLTALGSLDLHACLLSPEWGDFERGHINETETIQNICKELDFKQQSLEEALQQCRKTLCVDHELYSQLQNLKAEMDGQLKIYAMTNISEPDFVRLKSVLEDWSLFDGIFTSFEEGMIKPEQQFYHRVLSTIGLVNNDSAIFVDDKVVNVLEARSLGLQGIVFSSPTQLLRQLQNRLFDPITRARQYMRDNARSSFSRIENGPEIRDTFSQFFIYHILRDASLISLSLADSLSTEIECEISKAMNQAKLWNYFIGSPIGTTSTLPTDVDDTAMALLAFSPPISSANIVLDKFLSNRCARRQLIQTYFCTQRQRIDPWVLTNVVRLFYHYNRGAEVRPELEYVSRVLKTRAYVDGSHDYVTPELFLYFCSCPVEENRRDEELQRLLRRELGNACRERVGRRDDALAVAARILACQAVDVCARSDIHYLRELQDLDGGWEIGWVCCFGRSRKRIGSRGMTTAFAIKALEQDTASML
ncbi:HAD-like domain-containing protein [Boeremia exigua]|uniref:HAD-like domain-containing protein n=1 Tax=Boeremia exigua TaxID=749465 RepID=UPI001E8CE210|nr:HAD-like domain-containing protein [Boeremia exigua]KAH6625539.1 HAD-like domain-containing protein [Boeremia exigua]